MSKFETGDERDDDELSKRLRELESQTNEGLNQPGDRDADIKHRYMHHSKLIYDFYPNHVAVRRWGSKLTSACLNNVDALPEEKTYIDHYFPYSSNSYGIIDFRSTFVDRKRVPLFSRSVPLRYQGVIIAYHAPLLVPLPLYTIAKQSLKRDHIRRDTSPQKPYVNWSSFDVVLLFADYYNVKYEKLFKFLKRINASLYVSTLSGVNTWSLSVMKWGTKIEIGFIDGDILDFRYSTDGERKYKPFNINLFDKYKVKLYFSPTKGIHVPPSYNSVKIPMFDPKRFTFGLRIGLRLRNVKGKSYPCVSRSLFETPTEGSYKGAYVEPVVFSPSGDLAWTAQLDMEFQSDNEDD